MDDRSAKVRIALRVGVTGHCRLDEADTERLREIVGGVLEDICKAVLTVYESPDAKLLYRTEEPPLLQLLSALAKGADRLVASAAVDQSWSLIAPLPFRQAEYEQDFSDAVDEFRALLDNHARADARGPQVVELDGARERQNQAYLEVGRFVLRHSDLLIAVWNGKREKGVGGAGQIVREARSHGLPIIWIHSAAPHECRLLIDDGDNGGKPYDRKALETLARQVLEPLDPAHDPATAKKNRIALSHYVDAAVVELDETVTPDFLYTGPFKAKLSPAARVVGGFFGGFMRLCSVERGATAPGSADAIGTADPPAGRENWAVRTLCLAYQRADATALAYSNLHRSGYILIYLAGALALACAVAAVYFDETSTPLSGLEAKYLFTGVELVLLLFILALVLCDHYGRWQARWLDVRLLAELFRESDIMAQLGRSFPNEWLADYERDLPLRAWALRYYRAVIRAAGIVGSRYTPEYLESCRTYLETRIDDQFNYHQRNAHRSKVVNRRLKRVSEAFFVLTLASVIAKLLLPGYSIAAMAGLWAGVFPAIAYGSFLIRNQAEFELVVRRSDRMLNRLKRRRQALEKAGERDVRPLSAALGRQALLTGRVMLQDAAEWAGIFAVKETET